MRISVLLLGVVGSALAFGDESVFTLWLLSGDLIYCMIFPQLVCVLHLKCANTYGAIVGYVVGLLLRVLSGEPALSIPAVLLFPGWREVNGKTVQYFPFRTLAMLSCIICIIVVSKLVELGICHHVIPRSWDVLRVFEEIPEEDDDDEEEEDEYEVEGPLPQKKNILHTKF